MYIILLSPLRELKNFWYVIFSCWNLLLIVFIVSSYLLWVPRYALVMTSFHLNIFIIVTWKSLSHYQQLCYLWVYFNDFFFFLILCHFFFPCLVIFYCMLDIVDDMLLRACLRSPQTWYLFPLPSKTAAFSLGSTFLGHCLEIAQTES